MLQSARKICPLIALSDFDGTLWTLPVGGGVDELRFVVVRAQGLRANCDGWRLGYDLLLEFQIELALLVCLIPSLPHIGRSISCTYRDIGRPLYDALSNPCPRTHVSFHATATISWQPTLDRCQRCVLGSGGQSNSSSDAPQRLRRPPPAVSSSSVVTAWPAPACAGRACRHAGQAAPRSRRSLVPMPARTSCCRQPVSSRNLHTTAS
jgi:hypothetical protein